jgi:transcriptional regulator with XRE-family HTH domain
MTPTPPPPCDLADYTTARQVLRTLPAALYAVRVRTGLSIRAAAKEMRISFRTLYRLESDEHGTDLNGRGPNAATLDRVLRFIEAHYHD